MLLLDLTHTSHTRARTGIQRVARALYSTLTASGQAGGITWDPYARQWRLLESWEKNILQGSAPSSHRGAHWPWPAQLRGRWRRLTRATGDLPHEASGLIVSEIFSATTAAALPALLKTVRGPRIAIFHDAIALKYPELTPTRTVARFPAYLQELLTFDGIAAVSADSRAALLDYWRWLGVTTPPPVIALPLGLEKPSAVRDIVRTPATPPVLLSVGSIEGRKNHLALLAACEQLWAQGRQFTLHLIGLAHPQTGRAALDRIHALQNAGRPLRYDGPVDEAALQQAYARCTFTVYPSLIEGFGLPVLESLASGKPCICSGRGALGESAQGGGCLALARMDAAGLAAAIDRLLASPEELARLNAEAASRQFRSWDDYTGDLTAWLGTLPRR